MNEMKELAIGIIISLFVICIFLSIEGYRTGHKDGSAFVYDSIGAEIDLTKVPINEKATFEMRVRVPCERNKRGVPYLVSGSTESVTEDQTEEGDDE